MDQTTQGPVGWDAQLGVAGAVWPGPERLRLCKDKGQAAKSGCRECFVKPSLETAVVVIMNAYNDKNVIIMMVLPFLMISLQIMNGSNDKKYH